MSYINPHVQSQREDRSGPGSTRWNGPEADPSYGIPGCPVGEVPGLPPTPSDPAAFLRAAEAELLDLSVEASQADWVHATYITDDTQALAARANARLMASTLRWAKESAHLPAEGLSSEERRKARLLRLTLPLVAPSDPAAALELARTVADMQGRYAKGRHTPVGASSPVDLQALSRILSEVRDPVRLEDAWTGWHRVGREIREPFVRYVELANSGARELGFADTGTMWRSKYDMDPEEFAREVERLWEEVRPLYQSLHTYVRARLRAHYGPDRVPERGPIPAHLLGNMWAQSWEGIYPLVAPPGADAGYDLTEILVKRGTTPQDLVRYAERFFVSLGLPALPPTFWERSMFLRPQDREVICHASAWDIDLGSDLRIKMCIEITGDDFETVHHELGHNYYQRAYSEQPFLFRESAHDGFHEAVGDTISLSVTPEYLVRIGLLDRAPEPERDIGLLLYRALEKVAFLPFGLLVDRWRWEVFSGAISPAEYNRTWWEARRRYQGIAPSAPRGEEEFDAGAKFHIPANVPYMRYFLAHLLQFQFHRALVRAEGANGPLHRASIYGSKKAGERFGAMLAMGARKEWPDALEVVTGDRRMDAKGLLEYFAPLQRWLDEQNRGVPSGW
ncbi:MAG TPA: M2 family metallopeptidase [Thermoplasmata archaeon]|nr:M2 family metallopeptidase [Thermoplasmata archaeon]